MEKEVIISAKEAMANSASNKGKISVSLNTLIKQYSDVGLTSFRISHKTRNRDYAFAKLQIPMLKDLGYKVKLIPTCIVSNTKNGRDHHSEDMEISWDSEK